MEMWKKLFTEVIRTDYNTPLYWGILSNPKHKITCLFLYIYSMETFLVYTLNTATREKDSHKIYTLGPFASALRYIIERAEKDRYNDPESLDYYSYS